MAESWSDWIEHDGGPPMPLYGIGPVTIECLISLDSGSVSPESAIEGSIGFDHPSFYWKWTYKGFFRRRRIRVCHDPKYMAIKRYRYRIEKTQAEILRSIAADTSAPITGPEIAPKPRKEKTPWLKPSKNPAKTSQ